MRPSTFLCRRSAVLLVAGAAACGKTPPDSTPAPQASAAPAHEWPLAIDVPAGVAPRFERVILVTIDTLRRDHMSSYGYRRETTPFFDELAGRGALFTRAQAAVSHTAPSHATMLTGLPPLLHGVLENGAVLAQGAPDAAHMLHRAGFQTAAFLNVSFLRGITGSFDVVGVNFLQGRMVVDAALRWLEKDRKQERFFLWVHLYDPHYWKTAHEETPRNTHATWPEPTPDPAEFYAYLAELHGLPERVPDGPLDLGWTPEVKDEGELVIDTLEEYLLCIDTYDALILYADRELERLYRAVERLDLAGPTLWIVTSDHGEGLASHGIAGHGSRIYQEQLAVPLLVHASDGSIEPRRIDALVGHVDLLPTLAEVVGAKVAGDPALVEGRSLWPLVRGEDASDPERALFAERKPPAPEDADQGGLFALQDGRHKFLLHETGEDEFYDLAADPRELDDRSGGGSPEEDALRRELEARIERYRARAPASSDSKMPEEWLRELRALGYAR